MARKIFFGILLTGIVIVFFVPAIYPADPCPILDFEKPEGENGLPGGWEPVSYLGKRENVISLEKEGNTPVLHIKSLNSISGVMKPLDGMPALSCPRLSWSWKVSRTVGMAMEDTRDRSDAAARLRVIFGEAVTSPDRHPLVRGLLEYTGITLPPLEPAGAAVDYLWGNSPPVGALLSDPRSSRRKMIILERKNEKAGRWVRENRNLVEDFRRCFGKDPPGVAAVVLLSDTEDTNEGVEAWFKDLVLSRPEGK